jgi:hypothetical protein
MFIEICVEPHLNELREQIEIMRSRALAIIQCIEYMRLHQLPLRMNSVISNNIYDIYRAVEVYIICVEKIISECGKNKWFIARVNELLGAYYTPTKCPTHEWVQSLTAIERYVHFGFPILRASNTGTRHARELINDLQLIVREFDPDSIDWDLESVRMRITHIERRFIFMCEFFRALPPVQ